MKKLSALLLFALFISVGHAQSLINCATNTPCANGGPQNTGTGDNLPTAGTKINANFNLLPSAFFNGAPLPVGTGGTGATSLASAGIPVQSGSIISGHCATWLSSTTIGDAGASCGGSSTTFQANGAGLASSSTINFQSSAATNGLTLTFSNPSAGNVQLGLTGWPTLVNGDCLTNNGTTLSWVSCGPSAFSALTSGTNTAAAMVVGTGGSLAVTGSGTISATNTTAVNGAAVPASAAVLASNSSNQLTSASVTGTGNVVLATSPTIATPTISGNLTTNVTGSTQCVHANSAGVLSGTGSDCGSGGSTAFSALTGGTNTTAAMLVGTGASLGPTGTGTLSANQVNGATVPASASVVGTNASSQLVALTSTGTGNNVLATSPTLVTPALGTPSALVLTNASGLPATALPALTGDATSTAGTAATTVVKVNGGAIPVSAAVVSTNSSGQLTAATTTGSGSPVLATSPTLVTPTLGVATATTVNGSTVPTSAGTLPGSTGAFTTGHCLEVGGTTPLEIQDNGSACGSGGSTAFSALTGSTNTTAAMVIGTGASLAVTGTGTIAATNTTGVNGAVVPTSAGVVASNASNQLIAATTTGSGTVVLATSPTLVTPALGTPASGVLTNATGLPISTGVSGLATGIATFLATPSSANLATAVTNETGSGLLVFGTSPTLVTPVLSGATGSTQCVQVNTSGVMAGSGAGCGGGSGTVSSGTAGQIAYYASTGTTASGLTVGNGLAITSGTIAPAAAINAQTGTSYTVSCTTDAAGLITLSNASAVAVTLPQATSTCGAGFGFDVQNKGAGAVTITPTTSTINGASTLVIAQNRGCSVTSDGTNYQVSACSAVDPATNLAGTGVGGVTGTLPAASLPAALSSSTSVNGTTIAATAGTAPGSTGSFTTGHCLEVGSTSPLEIQDNGSACGSGGSTAFSALTGSTNTSAAMVIGTGASLAVTGSGTIAATNTTGVNGAAVATSAALVGTNSSGQLVSAVSGTPATGQLATWASSTTVQGQNNLPIGVTAATSATSITPNCTFDVNTVTASTTGTFTVNAPGTCTPANGQRMRLEVLSPSGGTITYAFNAAFKVSATLALPTTSNAASKEDDFEFEYSSRLTGWKLMAYNQGF